MNKSEFRSHIRTRIKELDHSYIISSNSRIYHKLITSNAYILAPAIFIYESVNREVDTHAIIEHAQKSGKQVYFPVVHGSGIMDFRWKNCIAAPSGQDLIIVPGLCFLETGYRLGQGGGYYDRYLAQFPQVHTIGLCRKLLLLDNLPQEPHDIPVNQVITD